MVSRINGHMLGHFNSPSPAHSVLTHAVHAALVTMGLVATATLAPTVQAQTADAAGAIAAVKQFQIPAGPLATALAGFAADAGVSVSAPPDLVRGKTTRGLQGSHGVQDGLARLLAGTGLEAAPGGGDAYVLRTAPTAGGAGASASASAVGATLPLVTITATAERSGTTEGTGSYLAGLSAGSTGLRLALRDTPQTVTVVTRQQMDDQGSTSVTDVMRQAPGITAQNYDSDRWSFNARGFSLTNFQYDGVSKDYDGVYDWGATNSDMAIFDRVEIVKGATGLMSGTGDPSATANFIRKRPTEHFAGSVTASGGSWGNGRVELDLSSPLNTSGSVRGRVVGAFQERDSFLDHYHQKKTVLYGVVEADLSRDTKLTVGADLQDTKPRGSTWTGFPIFYSDGSRTNWDRSFNPATTWSSRAMESRNLFATLEHRLENEWNFKLTANNERSQHRSLLGSASGGNPDPVTGEGMYFFMGDFQGNRTQNTVNASLSGPYELLGRKHEAMVGAMWSDTSTDGPWSESAYPMLPGSIFGWSGQYPQPDFPAVAHYSENRRQTGLYGATRLRPTDALSVILGARVSSVNSNDARVYDDVATSPLVSSLRESGVLTPYAGVVFDLSDTASLYGSYTSIFSPQSSLDANRNFLPPVKGRSFEAGVKGEYLDGRLNASLAAFHIQQDNVAEYVDFVDGESVYRPIKGVTSKGIEAEINGQIAPGWNLQAGYAYTHVRDAQGERVYGATLMLSQPAHTVRLATSYRLSGEWNALTVGGGLTWQSATYGRVWHAASNDYANVRQNGYALISLMARYQVSKELSVAMNIKNLFDKKYYSGMGLFDTGFYGEPRSVLVTARYQF